MRAACCLFALVACAPPAPAPGFEARASGITVRQSAIAVEGGAGRLIVVELAPGVPVTVVPASAPAPLQQIAGAARGCVSINGGFYDADGAMGWVVHAGEAAAPLRPGGGSGVFVITDAGPRIVHRDGVHGRPREALQSIDRLVDGGRSLVGANARPDADARSAVGLRSDDTIVFAVAFAEQAVARELPGRVELSAASSRSGLSLAAWAELLVELGLDTALNLDGGYSTSLSAHVAGLDLEVVAHEATINALRGCAG